MATQGGLDRGGFVAEWRRLQAEQLDLRVELGSEQDPDRRAELVERLRTGRKELNGFDVDQYKPATARPPSLYQFDDIEDADEIADTSASTSSGDKTSAQQVEGNGNGNGNGGDDDIDELLRTLTDESDGPSAESPSSTDESTQTETEPTQPEPETESKAVEADPPPPIVRRGTPPLPAGPPNVVEPIAPAHPAKDSAAITNPALEPVDRTSADEAAEHSGSHRPAVGAAVAGALGALALIGAGFLIWTIASNRASQAANGGDTTEEAVAGTAIGDPEHEAEELRDVLDVLGLDTVEVQLDGSVIHLTGTVASQDQHDAALQAAHATADDVTIDSSAFTVDRDPSSGASDSDGVEEAPVLTARQLALQNEIDQITAVTPIIFDAETSQVGDRQLRVLERIAEVLSEYPDVRVMIVGFTDASGDPVTNRELSLARATNVERYLVTRGIDGSRLDVVPYGEDGSTGSAALAGLERRVDFEVAGSTSG